VKITTDDPRLIEVTKERLAVTRIEKALLDYPMVVLSGPRKVGKTVALLQMAIKTENAEYLDCGVPEDAAELERIFHSRVSVLLLLDEIQKLKRCHDWVSYLAHKAQITSTFRVIITGSVAACMEILARGKAGGGRSKYVHIPIITYLEYLYLTNKITGYDTNLLQTDYGDSFYD